LSAFNNFTTSSLDLIFNIQRLYYKLGYFGNIIKRKCVIIDVYNFELQEKSSSFIENGYAWFNINDIETYEVDNIDVYNLSVINDNSYTVNNIAVHNCYGYQWRFFNAKYDCLTGKKLEENNNNGIDQLQQIIDALKDPQQRNSRRLIMTAWNPLQLNEMALPPCHVMCQFNVHDGNKLSCSMYQRSIDASLGFSFNAASYSFLTHLLAKHCGLEAYEFVYFMGNCHLYEDHIEPMKEILTREPYPFPTINIKSIKENINDYTVDDFEILNYISHDLIKMKMVA